MIFLGSLLAGLAGWSVHWFLTNHERHSMEIRTGVSPQAMRNPFLAAEHFLSRLGIDSESISGRDHLLNPPPEPGLLLVNNLGPSLPPERERDLLNWVREGGHLVVAPGQLWDEETETGGNSLLDAFGIRLISIEVENEDEEPAGDEETPQSEEETSVPIDLPGYRAPLQIAFDPDLILVDRSGLADGDSRSEGNGYVLRYAVGQGRLTVLSDNRIFTNNKIGDRDHALFLAVLADNQKRAWLLYSSNMPSLLTLLWQNAPQLLISCLLLLSLIVWRMMLWTGPLIEKKSETRRNLMEHLDAAAGYAWRTDQARGMFDGTRRVLEQAWRRRHLALGRLDRRARCDWIAERAGLAPEEVEMALYGDYAGEQEFTGVSAVQQRLAGILCKDRGKGS
jgi:hypothetical protein